MINTDRVRVRVQTGELEVVNGYGQDRTIKGHRHIVEVDGKIVWQGPKLYESPVLFFGDDEALAVSRFPLPRRFIAWRDERSLERANKEASRRIGGLRSF